MRFSPKAQGVNTLTCQFIVLFCRLAIIQLSTWNEVYILDMMSLTDNVKDSEMKHFAESFFANPQVLKLGKQFIFVFFLHRLND